MKYKLHYGKKQYLYTFLSIVAVLFVVRLCHPELTRSLDKQTAVSRTAKTPLDSVAAHALMTDSLLSSPYALPRDLSTQPLGRRHRILSVPGFERTFPDLNDVQIATAQRLGVKPVQNRDVASHADYHQLVYIGNSPYYDLKRRLANEMIETYIREVGKIDFRKNITEIEVTTPMTISHYVGAWKGSIYGYTHSMDNHAIARLQMKEKDHFIQGLEFAGAHGMSGDGMGPQITNGRAAAKFVLEAMDRQKEAAK